MELLVHQVQVVLMELQVPQALQEQQEPQVRVVLMVPLALRVQVA